MTQIQFQTIEWFIEQVNRRAESKMLTTGKLEGAHKAAMDEVFNEVKSRRSSQQACELRCTQFKEAFVDIANLTRYDFGMTESGFRGLTKVENGPWVKFEDIKEASLNSPASPVQQRYAEIAAQMGNVAEDNDSGLPEWVRDALSSWAYQLQQ